MNISFISHATLNHCCENMLSSLTASQKTIAAIALAILSCAALGYAFFRFCHFKATVLDSVDVKEMEEDCEVIVPENCFASHLEDGRTKKVFSDGMIEIGHFKEGLLNGEGTRIFPDETTVELNKLKSHDNIRRLKGTFKDGEFNGKGEILFFDGRIYEGEFIDGLLVEGLKRYSDVKSSLIHYESGTFVDDQLTGWGEIHFKDGKVTKGRFDGGHLVNQKEQVVVNGPNGFYDLSTFLDETVANFKLLVEKETEIGILANQMLLIYAGQLLEDGKNLQDYGIQKGATIMIFNNERKEESVFFEYPGGISAYSLKTQPSETISTLKLNLQKVSGIPVDQMLLIYRGRHLEDERTLSDYNIFGGAKISLILKMRGD